MVWLWVLLGITVAGIFFLLKPRSLITKSSNIKWLFFLIAGGTIIFLSSRFGFHILGFLLPVFYFFIRGLIRSYMLNKIGGVFHNNIFSSHKPSSGNHENSTIETVTLSMSLNHDTGQVSGKIKIGRFAGNRLEDLSNNSLLDLKEECENSDQESVALLEAYMDRIPDFDWREHENLRKKKNSYSNNASSPMTVKEACQVLGVGTDANTAEIKAAYHRLMLKIHPDQGGSDFLASKINQAKDLLLPDS